MAFCHLQTKLPKGKEALRVATAEVGTLQALLEIEREASTSDSLMERELVFLRHSHDRLRGVVKDLVLDATGLLRTHASNDLILRNGFGKLCQAVSNFLGHV